MLLLENYERLRFIRVKVQDCRKEGLDGTCYRNVARRTIIWTGNTGGTSRCQMTNSA